ncbi:hypothetical protein ACPOL_4841 [Acidisarcina polymorpha]|uniref:Uncharacterized protein n=1 Tax=Acidisarcina polymorpha TaxID=2211140 RepID=A0A2Z5G4H6_9BACT|nr:hypothetical protein ACPOL_4841 [Acidisarcina polymorpha]
MTINDYIRKISKRCLLSFCFTLKKAVGNADFTRCTSNLIESRCSVRFIGGFLAPAARQHGQMFG